MKLSQLSEYKFIRIIIGLTIGILIAGGIQAAKLIASPSVFDFGWCPVNAKVSCDFVIKNQSQTPVELESFRPTCGCTAPQFTPETLASDDETRIGLTFNTRGFEGMAFHKPATLKTGDHGEEIEVMVTGHVRNPNAKIFPLGSGIARFVPDGKDREILAIQNTLDKEVELVIVQKPANWADLDLKSNKIPAGGKAELSVKVKGSLEIERITSATFEAQSGEFLQRLTVAIQTGPVAPEFKPPQGTAPPAPTPKK